MRKRSVLYQIRFVCTVVSRNLTNELKMRASTHVGVGNGTQAWIERVAEIPVDGSNLRPDVCLIEVSLFSQPTSDLLGEPSFVNRRPTTRAGISFIVSDR